MHGCRLLTVGRVAVLGVASSLFITGVASAAPKRLTSGGFDWKAKISPDNKKVVYNSITNGNFDTGTHRIRVMNIDGSQNVALTDGSHKDEDPSWSPDGKKILFTSNRTGGVSGLYTMDLGGGDITRIFDGTVPDQSEAVQSYSAAWSPDGSRIVFGASKSQNTRCLASVNASGGDFKYIICEDGIVWGDPVFSSDGEMIVAIRQSGSITSGDLDSLKVALYRMKTDGTGITALNFPKSGSAGVIYGTPSFLNNAAIGFTSNYESPGTLNNKIYYQNFDGSGLTVITNSAGTDLYPDFDSGGANLVFTRVADPNGIFTGTTTGEIYSTSTDDLKPALVDPKAFKAGIKSRKRVRLSRLNRRAKKALKVTVTCSLDCSGTVELKVSKSLARKLFGVSKKSKLVSVVKKKTSMSATTGTRKATVYLRLAKQQSRKQLLKSLRRGSPKRAKMTLAFSAKALNESGTASATKRVTGVR